MDYPSQYFLFYLLIFFIDFHFNIGYIWDTNLILSLKMKENIMRNRAKTQMTLPIIGFVIAFIGFITWAVAFWTDRNLEFWLSKFQGHTVEVPFWLSFLVTLILNAVILAFNIVSELLRIVL